MPEGHKRREAEIRTDFAEAALETGFALVRLAESQWSCGARRDARRALREAEAARREGGRRLSGLAHSDVRIEELAQRLHNAILAARRDPPDAAKARRFGNLIQMPARKHL